MRRGARLFRVALAASAFAIAGPLFAGCPARQLEVQVTTDGANTLVVACESLRSACSTGLTGSCHRNHFLCTQDTCELRQACKLQNNPEWSPEQTMGMRVLLLQLGANADTVQSASSCVPLNLRPCILDPWGLNGCTCIQDPLGPVTCTKDPTGEATLTCIRDTLAQALQQAMGSGLSFSGFTSTNDVSLVLAFYDKPGNEQVCTGSVLVNPNDCAVGNLTAVAGMAAPAGATAYDITCASCQSGPHNALGPDNGPCAASTDGCFLQRVAAALTASGL
jgi:hypothetical protein